jgi:hypothetical protein
MKRFLSLILVMAILAGASIAGGKGGYVKGYYKSNGTYVNGYYRGGSSTYSTPSLPKSTTYDKPSKSSNYWSSPTVTPKQTYDIGSTTYIYGETYGNGRPKVERSSSARQEFLKMRGYLDTPFGYEVDHIVPLHWGGADDPSNMQLLTKEAHARKTAIERHIDATTGLHNKR